MDIHLKHHRAVLSRMCRICGSHCSGLKPTAEVHQFEHFPDTAKIFGLDVSTDDPSVHPASMCRRCQHQAKSIEREGKPLERHPYSFEPHSTENCQVCKFACTACLLIHNSVKPTANYHHYQLSHEAAVKERHRALLKAISNLTKSQSCTEIYYEKEIYCKGTTQFSDEHEEDCKLCGMPCPLCGKNLTDAASSYLIRFTQLKPSSRVLRPRKRKVSDTEESPEPVVKRHKSKRRKTQKNLGLLSMYEEWNQTKYGVKILPKVGLGTPSKNITGKYHASLFKSPTQTGSVLCSALPGSVTSPAIFNPNLVPIQLGTPVIPPAQPLSSSSVKWNVNPPLAAQISQAAANIVVVKSTNSALPTVAKIGNANRVSTSVVPSLQATNLSPVVTLQPLGKDLKKFSIALQSANKSETLANSTQLNRSSQSAKQKEKFNTGHTEKSFQSVLPKGTIEFGTAPRAVAKSFHDSYKKLGSLTACIRQALSMAPLLRFKYKFMSQNQASERGILIGIISKRDETKELTKQLSRLDKYVRDNHYRSRASAIEELLFSPLQNGIRIQASERAVETCKNLAKTVEDGTVNRYFEGGQGSNSIASISAPEQGKKETVFHCKVCGKYFMRAEHYKKHCLTFAHQLAMSKNQAGSIQKRPQKSSDTSPAAVIPLDEDFSSFLMDADNTLAVDDKLVPSLVSPEATGDIVGSLSTEVYDLTSRYTGVIPLHYRPFVTHKKGREVVVITCKFCQFTTKDFSEMVTHARKHIGDYPYRCAKAKCTHGAVSKAKLAAHHDATGHSGFYIIKRTGSLTDEQIKKLESLVRENKITYNDVGMMCVTMKSSKSIIKANREELYGKEPEQVTNTTPTVTSVPSSSNCVETNEKDEVPTADEDSGAWLFCRFCNTAFLDKETYHKHMKECSERPKVESDNNVVIIDDSDEEDATRPVSETVPISVEVDDTIEIVEPKLVDMAEEGVEHSEVVKTQGNFSRFSPLRKNINLGGMNRRSLSKKTPQKRRRLANVIAGLSSTDVDGQVVKLESSQDNVDEFNEEGSPRLAVNEQSPAEGSENSDENVPHLTDSAITEANESSSVDDAEKSTLEDASTPETKESPSPSEDMEQEATTKVAAGSTVETVEENDTSPAPIREAEIPEETKISSVDVDSAEAADALFEDAEKALAADAESVVKNNTNPAPIREAEIPEETKINSVDVDSAEAADALFEDAEMDDENDTNPAPYREAEIPEETKISSSDLDVDSAEAADALFEDAEKTLTADTETVGENDTNPVPIREAEIPKETKISSLDLDVDSAEAADALFEEISAESLALDSAKA